MPHAAARPLHGIVISAAPVAMVGRPVEERVAFAPPPAATVGEGRAALVVNPLLPPAKGVGAGETAADEVDGPDGDVEDAALGGITLPEGLTVHPLGKPGIDV